MTMFDPELVEFTDVIYSHYTGKSYRVRVYVLGGGTVGRKYARDTWAVQATEYGNENVVWLETVELYCGSPVTHTDVASIAFDYIELES